METTTDAAAGRRTDAERAALDTVAEGDLRELETVGDAAADVAGIDLDALYRAQLEGAVARQRAAWDGTAGQTIAMLAWMTTHPGGRLGADEAARAWVWADLHLNHSDIIECFGRPFRTDAGMRRALYESWRRTVGGGDLVICLGDVAVGSPNRTVDEELAGLPGRKVLVVGNHEFVSHRALPKDYGFEKVEPTLVCETDPPLLLTHEPLGNVPAGCLNVHGHLHGTEARSAARRTRRRLNVNVELTGYRPVRLETLAATARALLAGEAEPQRTTVRTIARAGRDGRDGPRSGRRGG